MIRLTETRAHRRANGALVKYLAQPMTLGRSEVTDAVAQHLAIALEENTRLRAQLLEQAQRHGERLQRSGSLKLELRALADRLP